MTEDEAKTKWCPFARPPSTGHCLASACMAWRWMPIPPIQQRVLPSQYPAPEGEGWKLDNDNGSAKFWSRSNDGPNRRGYCGLAEME